MNICFSRRREVICFIISKFASNLPSLFDRSLNAYQSIVSFITRACLQKLYFGKANMINLIDKFKTSRGLSHSHLIQKGSKGSFKK